MPEDVKARIVVSVESSDAAKQCDEVQRKLERITAAREKDLKVVNKKTEAIEKQKRAELELTQTIKNSNISPTGTGVRNTRPGEWRMATPLPDQRLFKDDAEKELNARKIILEKVNKRLEEYKTISLENQKINVASSKTALAEYRARMAIAEQMEAERQYNIARNAKRNAIRSGEKPEEVLKLSRAYDEQLSRLMETSAAADKLVLAYKKLTPPETGNKGIWGFLGRDIDKSSRSMKTLNLMSSRLTKNIGGASAGMARFGLWGVAAGLAVKNLSYYFDLNNERLREGYELAKSNQREIQQSIELQRMRSGWQNEAGEKALSFQGRERLSFLEQAQQRLAIKDAGADWERLGLKIDQTTGALDAYSKIRLRTFVDQKKYQDQITAFDREYRALEEILKEGRRFTKAADAKVVQAFLSGNEFQDSKEVSEELKKFIFDMQKNRQERKKAQTELDRSSGIYFKEAIRDRAHTLENLVALENQQYQIQLRQIRGDEQGAAWLQRELELRKQIDSLTSRELEHYRKIWETRQRITQLAQVERFNTGFFEQSQIRDLMGQGRYKEAEWLKYQFSNLRNITDSAALKEARKNWENDYNSRVGFEHRERLKSLGKELEIENLLIAGDERRARLAKWQNELEKQGLKPEQLKAELAAREQLHQTQQFRHDWGALAERMRQTPMTRFRETAQSAVMADSLEAVRLQSRVTMQNPEMKILNEQLKILKDVKQVLSQMNQKGSTLTVWTP